MTAYTTIQVDKNLVRRLGRLKKHPRQSYNEVISEIVESAGTPHMAEDRFLKEVQKRKMKELWDNPEDEAWEHA